jgi:hypothetical protein
VTVRLSGSYTIEFSPDLKPPWAPLLTTNTAAGVFLFRDRLAIGGSRFYRVIGP